MNANNAKLQSILYFSNSDLNTNRGGVLSARQQARQRAAGGSLRLALGVFILVMLGTLGMLLFFGLRTLPETLSFSANFLPVLIAIGVILVVIGFGIFSSRRYIKTNQSKKIAIARGVAAPGEIRADLANFLIKIGETSIRLTTMDQLEAFEPGVAYRIFYLPGPVPVILSGEVIGTEADSDFDDPSKIIDRIEQDEILGRHRAGRLVLVVLVGLIFLLPLAGFAATSLPVVLRWLVMFGLLGIAIGFVFWSLRQFNR